LFEHNLSFFSVVTARKNVSPEFIR
jgi:hypothetical protein